LSVTSHVVLSAAGIGIGASLLMDAWNLFLKRAFGIRSLNYCMLGRWFLHLPNGTFVHANIGVSPARRFECPVGWTVHYSIGIVLALLFLVLAPDDWLARPTLLPALLFGIVTVVFPLFVLQPSLGLGLASSKSPKPAQARLKSLGTHTVFGVGLYLCGLILSQMGSIGW
jgi:hypothetical protein